jgi:CRISPR-associated protein Cas2
LRSLYLVGYDVRDDKRLRNVYRTMRGYGERIQYSVFVCDLSPKEKAIMVGDLTSKINKDMDSIIIMQLGPSDGKTRDDFEFIGQKRELPEREAIVV